MNDCPNPDCQKRLEGHHTTLFGKDGMGGLVRCTQRMVTRNFLMWCAVIVISVGGTIAGLTYRAYCEGQDEKNRKIIDCEKITRELDKNVEVMKNDIGHIKRQLEKQGTKQEKIIELLQKLTPKDPK